MKKTLIKAFLFSGLLAGLAACGQTQQDSHGNDIRYRFGGILDISLTSTCLLSLDLPLPPAVMSWR